MRPLPLPESHTLGSVMANHTSRSISVPSGSGAQSALPRRTRCRNYGTAWLHVDATFFSPSEKSRRSHYPFAQTVHEKNIWGSMRRSAGSDR